MISATHSNHPLGTVSTSTSSASRLDEALTKLKNSDMRVTKSRIAILEALDKHVRPVTIERIYQDIGADICDVVTVYRCLTAFEELGLVQRSYLHAGTCLYELRSSKSRHYHVICKVCNQTDRIDYHSLEVMESSLADRGYSQISHILEFFGVCPACQLKAPVRNTIPAIPSEQF